VIPDKIADRLFFVTRVLNIVALAIVAVLMIFGISNGDGGSRRKPIPPPPDWFGSPPTDSVVIPLCEACEIRARRAAETRT
jgi:hypothetical protein